MVVMSDEDKSDPATQRSANNRETRSDNGKLNWMLDSCFQLRGKIHTVCAVIESFPPQEIK
jgi:hypothetical protein